MRCGTTDAEIRLLENRDLSHAAPTRAAWLHFLNTAICIGICMAKIEPVIRREALMRIYGADCAEAMREEAPVEAANPRTLPSLFNSSYIFCKPADRIGLVIGLPIISPS